MKTGIKPSKGTQISTSSEIAGGPGALTGIFVSSCSGSPTIKVWDNTAGSGTVLVDTFTPVAATSYRFPDGAFNTGCYSDPLAARYPVPYLPAANQLNSKPMDPQFTTDLQALGDKYQVVTSKEPRRQ